MRETLSMLAMGAHACSFLKINPREIGQEEPTWAVSLVEKLCQRIMTPEYQVSLKPWLDHRQLADDECVKPYNLFNHALRLAAQRGKKGRYFQEIEMLQ